MQFNAAATGRREVALTSPRSPCTLRPMSQETPGHTRLSAKGRAQLDERRSRQAQALRDNLRKRKAQIRERSDPADSLPTGQNSRNPGDEGEP